MLSPHLVRQIELRADRIAEDLADRLQADPRTPSYKLLGRENLSRYVLSVYRNLGSWVAGRTDEEIEAYFGRIGAARYHEQVPIDEMVTALVLAKRVLRDHTHQVSGLSSAVEIHSEMEVDAMIGRFFDKLIVAQVRGYEAARSRAGERPRHEPTELGELKPTNMGWVP